MSLMQRAASAARRSNKSAWAAGLALVGTYVLARMLERDKPQIRGLAPAGRPARFDWAAWKHILYRTYVDIGEHRVLAVAAGVVFYALLALFPAITALVSSYALFADASTITGHLTAMSDLMPKSAFGIVNEQVSRIVSRTTGDLSFTFFIGLGLALWSANAGVKAIIDALNVVYEVKERRSFIKLNLISLTFTAGAIIGLLLAFASIVVLPIVFSYLPLFGADKAITTWLRWPALLLLLLFGLALLYRFGPDRDHPRWQWISPGALFAAIAWLAGSVALSWYLGSFADYDATYGSLGAGIGLMMWLWMSAILVLAGAELNSEFDAVQMPPPRDSDRVGG